MGNITNSAMTGVTPEKIADQICAAIEGGSGYWLASFKPISIVRKPHNNGHEMISGPWYALPSVWSNPFIVHCETHEDGAEVLTEASISMGLKWLSEHHPHRVAEIEAEDGDADTADVFLQACLFGEIRYG